MIEVQIAFDTELVGPPTMNNKVTLANCVGVVFLEKIGNDFYPLKSMSAMKIIEGF